MKVLLVTYDLKNHNRNYSNLYEALKMLGKWCHYLESTWLIATDMTPEQLYNHILPTIDSTDLVLVIEIKKNYWGSLPEEAWKWIQENLSE